MFHTTAITILTLLCANLAAAAAAAAPPPPLDLVIFWMSEPVIPGSPALLAISSKAATASTLKPNFEIFGRQAKSDFVKLPTAGETAYGLTVTIPAGYQLGEFDLQARRGNTTGPVFRANVPRPWFLFGNQGDTATPGGSVRVIGDGIVLPSPLSVSSMADDVIVDVNHPADAYPVPQQKASTPAAQHEVARRSGAAAFCRRDADVARSWDPPPHM